MSAPRATTGRASIASRIAVAQNQKETAERLLVTLARQTFKARAVAKLWRRDRFVEVAVVEWSRVDLGEKTRVRVQNVESKREYFTTAGELLTSLQLSEF